MTAIFTEMLTTTLVRCPDDHMRFYLRKFLASCPEADSLIIQGRDLPGRFAALEKAEAYPVGSPQLQPTEVPGPSALSDSVLPKWPVHARKEGESKETGKKDVPKQSAEAKETDVPKQSEEAKETGKKGSSKKESSKKDVPKQSEEEKETGKKKGEQEPEDPKEEGKHAS